MALTIPNVPNPFDPAHPYTNAYGWIAGLGFDSTNGTGRVTVWIHASPEAAYADPIGHPIDTFGVALGEVLIPAASGVDAVTFPMLPQIVGEAGAYQQANPTTNPLMAIQHAIESHLTLHPKLLNSTTFVLPSGGL